MAKAMRRELKEKLRWCISQEEFTTWDCANHFNVMDWAVRRQLATLNRMGILGRVKINDGELHYWMWSVKDMEAALYWINLEPVRPVNRREPTAVKRRKTLINSVFALGSL